MLDDKKNKTMSNKVTHGTHDILNVLSISPGILEDVCAKSEMTSEQLWNWFQEIIRSDRPRHTDDESTVHTACERGAEFFGLADEKQARELYDILEGIYKRRRR